MSLFWSLFKRFEQFLISSADKSNTKRFLKLNADSRYYRINLNEIRERISTGKEYCSAKGARVILEYYLEDFEYEEGEYPGEYDKNTPFANDEGVYLFIKAGPDMGKIYEERFRMMVKEDAIIYYSDKSFIRFRETCLPFGRMVIRRSIIDER